MNRAKFLGLFLDEARAQLRRAAEDLGAFEATPQQPATLNALMRHCHSLKGMAATMGFEPFVNLAHRMEGLLRELENRPRLWSGELTPLLAGGIDQLNDWIEEVEAGRSPVRTPESDALLARIESQLSEDPSDRDPGPQGAEVPLAQWSIRLTLQVSNATPTRRVVSTLGRVSALGRVLHVRPPQLPLDDRPAPMELRLDLASTRPYEALCRRLARLAWVSNVEVTPIETRESPVSNGERPVTWTRVPADTLDWIAGTVRELAMEDGGGFLLKRLFDKVEELRLVPFVSLSHRLEPAVRDAARRERKQVTFRIRGGDLGLDPLLLDRLIGPLRHLVRNAVAHGIESPEERMSAGKSPTGHVEIVVQRDADRVLLTIADDGRGMEARAIRAAAVAKGVIDAAKAEPIPEADVLRLALRPGVTTRAEPDGVAGRGAGLDSVMSDAEALGATLEIRTETGGGTRMILDLPIEQALVQSLVFKRGGQCYGIPLRAIRRASSAGTPPVDCRIVDLGQGDRPLADDAYLLLLDDSEESVALAADEVLGRRELWLQPTACSATMGGYVYGAALIEDGSTAIMIDPRKLQHGQ